MNLTNDSNQNDHDDFQQFDSEVYKSKRKRMGRHSKSQKKQITNFIATGQELEVYQSDQDDELDDLTERFANNRFLYDSDPEENSERAVETCTNEEYGDYGEYGDYYDSNCYESNYFENCDDPASFYQCNGDFYEDGNLNQHTAFDQPNDEFNFDPQPNFNQSGPEAIGSQPADSYWNQSEETANCSFAGQSSIDHHRPIEEEKLTGLELVPVSCSYPSEEDDPPSCSRFDFDFYDASHYKENVLDDPDEPDEFHEDWLEIYKRVFRENFPELFTERKKRKKNRYNLRNLLHGDESSSQKRPKDTDGGNQFQLDDQTPLPSQTIDQEIFEDHLTILPDSAFEDLFE